jgi:1,2-diacylglycerol 3-alpha-glucosyltransferase
LKAALLFDHFGPYHRARLAAASAKATVFGVEFYSVSKDYQWRSSSGSTASVITISTTHPDSRALTRQEFEHKLIRILEQIQPDVVAIPGWSAWESITALYWSIQRGIPVVMMSESSAQDADRLQWKEWIKRRILKLCSSGFVGGSRHEDYLRHLGMSESIIFRGYDVVDNRHFQLSPTETAALEKQKRFLASSRFIEKKNLFTLIRAYKEYLIRAQANNLDPWHLCILGDGPLRDQLQSEIQNLNLDRLVELPGFKQYDELPSYYGSASVFVHVSTVEQWGLVVNEAMAAGLPVLVSKHCGCVPDLVTDGQNGYSFDPYDQHALAQLLFSMSTLYPTELNQMGAQNQKTIANWSPEKFGVGLHQACTKALLQPRKRLSIIDHLLLSVLKNR